MHKRTLATIGFALILLSTAIMAADSVEIPPLEDKVKEIQLDNGLKVVVVERHNAPVFFALMNFRVGSTIEDVGKSGLSHFMEHMLFKGSETFGTKDYALEKPIMDELESIATEMRDLRISLEKWRYEIFEEYLTEIKSKLSDETRQQVNNDETSIWKILLENLPESSEEMPEQFQSTDWLLKYNNRNYWVDYRQILEYRHDMATLLKAQRQYIIQTALDGVYSTRGGQMVNAFTSYDQTGYMVGLPSNCLELWMNLESDRFQNPVFREFYAEREVVQEELLGRENDPRSRLFKIFLESAFVAHPYGRPIIGWREDIQMTLRSEMDNHFHRFYGPNNAQITIVGNVDPEEVFSFARQYFSSWKTGEVAHEVTVKEPVQTGERRVTVEFDAEPMLMTGYHVPAAPHPDFYALQIATEVLSSGRTSRFYKKIFEQKGLTAGAPGAFIGPSDRYPGLFIITAGPNAAHTLEEVEAALWDEIVLLKNEKVTDWELERVRNRYKNQQLMRLRSNQWLAFSLSDGFVNHGDWRSIVEDYERMMEVTADDIQRVARKYFTKSNRTTAFLVKPEETIQETEKLLGGNDQ